MFASLHTAVLAIRRVHSRGTFARAFREIAIAVDARRQHRAIASLDDATLRDIGITRVHALAEAHRPFRDFPATRRTCSTDRAALSSCAAVFSVNRLK